MIRDYKLAVFVVGLLWALVLSVPGFAQAIGGNASLSVTTASGSVALPAATPNYPAILITPASGSTQEVFYALGGSSITATTSSPSMPSGGICFANYGVANTYLAAITAANTATLRITQLSQCPQSWNTVASTGSSSNPSSVVIVPSTTGTPPCITNTAGGVVCKNTAGVLYGAYVTNAAAGFLMIFNSTTVPGDGATTVGLGSGNLEDCVAVAAGTSGSANYIPFAESYTVGISAVWSTTGCATKTQAAPSMLHLMVQ